MLFYVMLYHIMLSYLILSYLILSYLILSYFSSFFSFPHQGEYYDKKDNFDHTTLSKKNIFQEYQVRNED